MQSKGNQQKAKITQSQIEDLLKDSELQESSMNQQSNFEDIQRHQQRQLNHKGNVRQSNESYGNDEFQNYSQSQTKNHERTKVVSFNPNNNNYKNQSQSYGDDQFESFEESKRTLGFKKGTANNHQSGQYYQSYGNQSFQNYSQSKKIQTEQSRQFQRKTSKQNRKDSTKKNEAAKTKELTAIRQQKSNSKNKKSTTNSKNPLIKTDTFQTQTNKKVNKSSKAIMMNLPAKDSKNLPYKYERLQEREKQLLFTTITEQNKSLRQQLSERDKQFSALKLKYNILMEQKTPQAFNNAKQATMNKKLMLLQEKYNILLKERERDQQLKGKNNHNNFSKSVMGKTTSLQNNFVHDQQARTRQQELNLIIDKLKQRLISTDKELKTLQTKMNQGLDYTDQLQRKLKRVEQLQFKIEKMKNEAQTDRSLIQNLKQKTKQQTNKIQQLKRQKVHLEVCLKRSQMSGSTNQDIIEELQEIKKQKEILQKSLRDLTFNFSNSLTKPQRAKSPPKDVNFEDSQDLLRAENINRSASNGNNNNSGINSNNGGSSKPKFSKKI